APLADQPSAKGRITNTPLQVVQNRLKEKDRYNKEKSKRNELKPFHLRAESAQEKLLQLQLKETASIQTETRKFLVTLEVLSAALIKVANDLTSEKSEQKKTKMIECARGLARDIDTIRAVARTVSLAFDDSVSAVTKETDKLIVSKAQSIQSLNCGMRNQISNYQKQIEEIYTAVPADVREGVSNAVVASQNEQATASEKSTGSIFSWIADTFMSFVSSRYYNTEHPDQAIAGAIGRFKLDARKIVQKMQSGRSVSNSSSSDPDEELFIPRSPSMSAVKAQ
ncbi:MAG: hypothetical protein JSS53_01400, partial [Proteobacteria bacterium]|nr:hypothetical protein [Pseudomonadota bacterium]